MSPKIQRLLSFVLMAAVLPLLGIYAIAMKAAMPSVDGGMEPTVAMICYIAFTTLAFAVIVVCIDFSRQLAREAKGDRQLP